MRKLLLSGFFILTFHIYSFSQCAMCRATLENRSDETATGSTINEGILYLMPIPYILVAIIGSVFYYRYKKRQKSLGESN